MTPLDAAFGGGGGVNGDAEGVEESDSGVPLMAGGEAYGGGGMLGLLGEGGESGGEGVEDGGDGGEGGVGGEGGGDLGEDGGEGVLGVEAAARTGTASFMPLRQ